MSSTATPHRQHDEAPEDGSPFPQEGGSEGRYYRKVIRITAEDSPNVRLGHAQRAAGRRPTGEVLLPGVLPWSDYLKRVATWDEIRQTIGLRAQFYEGAEVLLYPPAWLDRAEAYAVQLEADQQTAARRRTGRGLGCDPGQGGAQTAWVVVDEWGVLELVALRTPDTTVVTSTTLAMMRKWSVDPARVCLDYGGGGKEHVDRLRLQGYPVRAIGFGEPVTAPLKRAKVSSLYERVEQREDRYVYVNRRAEMYGELRLLLDPNRDPASFGLNTTATAFGLPRRYAELRRQLAPMPLLYDPEGRMKMLPKDKRSPDSAEKTLTELLGCSPDQADALALAVHAMLHEQPRAKAGAR